MKLDGDLCQCQQDTETLAAELCAAGLPSAPYHAQMDPLARQDVHRRWAAGALSAPFATRSLRGRNLILIAHRQLHLGSSPITLTCMSCGVIAGELRIIVGTVAFGMGINKVDVRFVVHHTLAK